jgi:hypothetical protein
MIGRGTPLIIHTRNYQFRVLSGALSPIEVTALLGTLELAELLFMSVNSLVADNSRVLYGFASYLALVIPTGLWTWEIQVNYTHLRRNTIVKKLAGTSVRKYLVSKVQIANGLNKASVNSSPTLQQQHKATTGPQTHYDVIGWPVLLITVIGRGTPLIHDRNYQLKLPDGNLSLLGTTALLVVLELAEPFFRLGANSPRHNARLFWPPFTDNFCVVSCLATYSELVIPTGSWISELPVNYMHQYGNTITRKLAGTSVCKYLVWFLRLRSILSACNYQRFINQGITGNLHAFLFQHDCKETYMLRYLRQVQLLSESGSLQLKLHNSLFFAILRLAILELPYDDNSVRGLSLAPPSVSPNFNKRQLVRCHSFSNMSVERSLSPEFTVSSTRESRCLFQSVLESQECVNIDVVLYNSCAWLPEVVQEECLPKLRDPCSQFCQREERLCVVHCPERNTFASGLQNGLACISLRQLEERLATVHGPERSTSSSGPMSDPNNCTDAEGKPLDAHSTEPSLIFPLHSLDSLARSIRVSVQAQKREPTASLFQAWVLAQPDFNSASVQAQKREPTASLFQAWDSAQPDFNSPEGMLKPMGSASLSSRHFVNLDIGPVLQDSMSHTALISGWAQERKPTVFLSQAPIPLDAPRRMVLVSLLSRHLLFSDVVLDITSDTSRQIWCRGIQREIELKLATSAGGLLLFRDSSLHELLESKLQIKNKAIATLHTVYALQLHTLESTQEQKETTVSFTQSKICQTKGKQETMVSRVSRETGVNDRFLATDINSPKFEGTSHRATALILFWNILLTPARLFQNLLNLFIIQGLPLLH